MWLFTTLVKPIVVKNGVPGFLGWVPGAKKDNDVKIRALNGIDGLYYVNRIKKNYLGYWDIYSGINFENVKEVNVIQSILSPSHDKVFTTYEIKHQDNSIKLFNVENPITLSRQMKFLLSKDKDFIRRFGFDLSGMTNNSVLKTQIITNTVVNETYGPLNSAKIMCVAGKLGMSAYPVTDGNPKLYSTRYGKLLMEDLLFQKFLLEALTPDLKLNFTDPTPECIEIVNNIINETARAVVSATDPEIQRVRDNVNRSLDEWSFAISYGTAGVLLTYSSGGNSFGVGFNYSGGLISINPFIPVSEQMKINLPGRIMRIPK